MQIYPALTQNSSEQTEFGFGLPCQTIQRNWVNSYLTITFTTWRKKNGLRKLWGCCSCIQNNRVRECYRKYQKYPFSSKKNNCSCFCT